jgi:hypothetical protein
MLVVDVRRADLHVVGEGGAGGTEYPLSNDRKRRVLKHVRQNEIER